MTLEHGNGQNGIAVLKAALVALGRLDPEHAAAYFQMIYNGLREPMQRALEALAMERQTGNKATFPPLMQRLIDDSRQKGKLDGKLDGLREVLVRLLARAGITLTDDARARIGACADDATLDRWVENVLGAKSIDEVLS